MGKTYVITGSTSGIGEELVKTFSQNGENLVFAGYRNAQKLPQNSLKNIVYFYIDMMNETSIIEASNFIKTKTNKIDTLINVAGNVVAGPIEKINVGRLREQFEVNTFSHILFTQNLVETLNGGKIINISSESSYGHFPFISPYCASKRALDIFFNAFSIENHKNIKVISVKPGVIKTPIWEKSVQSNLEFLEGCEEYKKELEFIKNNALKNTNKGLCTEEVAQLIKKIDSLKNPKSTYTIGKDAKFAQFLSILPQDLTNKIIKFGMKCRIK